MPIINDSGGSYRRQESERITCFERLRQLFQHHTQRPLLILICCWGVCLLQWPPLLQAQKEKPQKEKAAYSSADLWHAAKTGDTAELGQIIDSGVEVDAQTAYGATALAFAAERGHLEVVKMLITRGANVNNVDTFYQFTPYRWATMGGNTEVAEFLKENGGLISVETDDEPSPEEEDNPTKSEPEFAPPPISSEQIKSDDQSVCSEHWPQFRGFQGRGIGDGHHVPLRWDAPLSKNLRWKTPIPGLGHSSPVIWANRIYVSTAVSASGNEALTIGHYGDVASVDDQSLHRFILYAIDRETGEIVWERTSIERIPRLKRHLKSTHANATATTNGKFVVVSFGTEGLFCYSDTGDLVWQKDLGSLSSGWFYDDDYEWGFGSSPVVWNDRVLVQCDAQEKSYLAALALVDGSELWKVERDEIPSWSTPSVYDTPAGPMLITNATHSIRGYDAQSGDLWWTLSGGSEIVVPTPFVAYGSIFAVSGYRPIKPIYSISLRARGDISLHRQQTRNEYIHWSTMQGGSYLPTPVAYQGRLYVCSNRGVISCYNAITGEQLYKKRLQLSGLRSFVSSPVAADGHVFLTAEDGNVIVIQAGDEFHQLHENPIGESVLSTPAIVEGNFYVRGHHHLFALTDKGEISADSETFKEEKSQNAEPTPSS